MAGNEKEIKLHLGGAGPEEVTKDVEKFYEGLGPGTPEYMALSDLLLKMRADAEVADAKLTFEDTQTRKSQPEHSRHYFNLIKAITYQSETQARIDASKSRERGYANAYEAAVVQYGELYEAYQNKKKLSLFSAKLAFNALEEICQRNSHIT